MRLTENIWLVASGGAGVGLTNSYDCNVYLVRAKEGFVLIDCGVGLETQRIEQQMKAEGFDARDCKGILITHAHADHSGGAAWLTGHTGARAFALAQSAEYITNGDTEAISLDVAIKAGVYPADYRFTACAVEALQDGQEITLGGFAFTAVATPGHCSGHCGYLVELGGVKTLFSGDCIYPGGKIALQPIWDCSVYDYMHSIRRLAELDFDALIPSHHGFLLENGKAPVWDALKTFDVLGVPPGPM